MEELVASQRECFRGGGTRPLAGRRERLERLATMLERHEESLLEALAADLGKDRFEAYVSELAMVLAEIKHARRHLRRWMKPRRVGLPPFGWPGRAEVRREPAGVVLVLAPWNYPLQLALAPVVSALAAGNTVILKLSEHAPATAEVLARAIGETFPREQLAAVTGGAEVAEELVAQPVDHLFFTGSAAIGRKVAAAAAPRLIPVTLELGGKCPAIVDRVEDHLELTARRIVWGKLLNAGQTCVAPDHVWVRRELEQPLIEALERAIANVGPERIGRMIHRRHFERVRGLLEHGEVVHGGGCDEERLSIEPTLLRGVALDSPLMEEEIFGPLLPVIAYDSLDEPLAWLRGRGAPLAVYVFSEDREVARRVESETRSGGVAVNDCVLQITGPELPFGGVGESGHGRYHGRAGFDCFSWQRSVLRRGFWPDFGLRYAPPNLSFEAFKRLVGGRR